MRKRRPILYIDLTALLFFVFVVLKATGCIDWSWWWVFSPLWLPLALPAAIAIVGLIVLGFVVLYCQLVKP